MLSDERQILNLLHLYCELQDEGAQEAVSELFRHGSFRVENGPAAHGFDAVYALRRKHDRVHEDGTLRTKHVTTNTQLDLDPEADVALVPYPPPRPLAEQIGELFGQIRAHAAAPDPLAEWLRPVQTWLAAAAERGTLALLPFSVEIH